MPSTVACDDQASPRVKRKPAPPAATVIHQTPSSSSHRSSRPQHHVLQSIAKPGLAERYPDPDPTDPFAPLWVLRNRTCSASPKDGRPALEHFKQRTDEFGSRLGRTDRRHSTSYLLQSFTTTSSADGHESISRLAYASDHGHGGGSIGPRTSSCTNGATGATVSRHQSFRPTRLSQVTALAIPSVPKTSKAASPDPPISPMHVSQRPQPSRVDVEGSGIDGDATRIGPLEAVELMPRVSVQAESRSQQLHEVEIEEQETSRPGSANKITRFLRTRRTSQSGSRPQTVRASVADINRIRKASISPPVTSSVVWAGHGQDFVPIKDHPLHRAAIPIVAATLDVTGTVLSPSQAEALNATDIEQCYAAAEAAIPIQASVNQVSPSEVAAAVPHSTTPAPPSAPPTLAKHHSQTSRAHTDESHSTFSFVHVPSTFSSSSLAHFTQENIVYEAPVLARRPSTAPLLNATGPGVSATIASSATMRIKRRSSLKIPLTHTISPLSPLNSMSTVKPLSPIQSDSESTIGEWDMPTFQAISMAASLPVIAESGIRINFGSLFLQRRAVVVFIRHFWCPLCQDYMTSVTSLNRSGLLFGSEEKDSSNEKTWGIVNGNDKEGRIGGPSKLIVIGNGSYTMIGKYKQIFGAGAAGLEVYTDPSLAVYNALGMGKDPASLSDHTRPFIHREGRLRKGRGSPPQARLDVKILSGDIEQKDISDGTQFSAGKDCSSGGYVKHGLVGGIAMVFVRALKVGMPVWEKGGDLHQLGGEFVFGPGLTCAYAHRMQNTKGHAPFEDALRAAGIIIPPPSVRPLPQAKTREARTRALEKKGDSRTSKSQNPSIGGNRSTASKLRPRGQTINVTPVSAPIADIPSSIPASASTPTFYSEPTQVRMRTSRERRQSMRDRQNSVHLLNDEVPIVISGPGVRPNGKQTQRDHEREWNLPVPIHTPTPLSEPDWTENRHRSLQTIKERKNARRGLGSVEGQVISGSISISKSKSHSRPLSPPGPHSSSCSVSQASQIRQYRERSKSRLGLDYESGFGPDGVGVASDWKPSKGRGGKGSIDVDHVQSDTGGISIQVKGRGGDDVVSLAREMKVNLSRDRLAQREWEESKEKEVDHILTGCASEEDVKTVSDKTLVHQ